MEEKVTGKRKKEMENRKKKKGILLFETRMNLENIVLSTAKHRKTNTANSAGSHSWTLKKMTVCQGLRRGARVGMVQVNEMSASQGKL